MANDDFVLDLEIAAVPISPDLKLKQQVSQVNELTVSELVFNTGNTELDRDLPAMFKQLHIEEQKLFEGNGGDGSLKNLIPNILLRTMDLTDHKVLPKEAVMLMFSVASKVSVDHTLLKDSKMTKEEMAIKSQARILGADISGELDILKELEGSVKDNNSLGLDDESNLDDFELDLPMGDDLFKDL